MSQHSPSNLEADLATHLGRSRSVKVSGFADRVVLAVHAYRRRQIIRWSSFATSMAACLVASLVYFSGPSEESLIQQTQSLVRSDEASQLSALLGMADDLSMLTPVVDKNSLVVDVLDKTEI
jgi:hypothetical protein